MYGTKRDRAKIESRTLTGGSLAGARRGGDDGRQGRSGLHGAEGREPQPGVFGRGAARKGWAGRVRGEGGEGVGAGARRRPAGPSYSIARVAEDATELTCAEHSAVGRLDMAGHHGSAECGVVCPWLGTGRAYVRRGHRRRLLVAVAEDVVVQHHCGQAADDGMRGGLGRMYRRGESNWLPGHRGALQHRCRGRGAYREIVAEHDGKKNVAVWHWPKSCRSKLWWCSEAVNGHAGGHRPLGGPGSPRRGSAVKYMEQ